MSFESVFIDVVEDSMVFAVAIVVFGKGWYDKWLKHQERKLEIKLMSGEPLTNEGETVRQLKQEIEKLRDTSTQYDISIDHTLQELKERIKYLEARIPADKQYRTGEEEPVSLRRE